MLTRVVITGYAVALSGVTLLARILGNAGQPVTQASLSAIAYTVTDLTAGSNAGSGTFTIADAVFDSLQTDPRWQEDSAASPGPDGLTGYNFLATLPGSLFPLIIPAAPTPYAPAPAPHSYQADVAFTPTSGEAFRVVWQFPVLPVYA